MRKPIINHSFELENIPPTWRVQTLNHTYERGSLHCGKVTEMMIPLSGVAWNHLRVEIDAEAPRSSAIDCCGGTLLVVLAISDSPYTRHRILKHSHSSVAEVVKSVPHQSGIRKIIFEFQNGRASAWVDGELYIDGCDEFSKPSAGWVTISLWNQCVVHRIRVFEEQPVKVSAPILPRRGDFFLDMEVDFYDDWSPDDCSRTSPDPIKYSRAMYDEFFARLAEAGVKRVPWNYHDLIAGEGMIITDEKNIGDNFKLAVEMAHKHGLQIFGTIKPFEVEYFARYNKAQPGFLMARKPGAWGKGENEIIQRIDIVKEDDRACAFTVEDVLLHVSDDNQKYYPYSGPIQCEEIIEEYPVYEATASGRRKTGQTRRSRVMRLSGLNIPHRYLALLVGARERSFVNELVNLVHLFGEKGEERIFTYGTASNTRDRFLLEGGIETGIIFGNATGTPSGVFAGYDPVREPFVLDAGQGFLGFDRHKDQYYEYIGSPSHPEVREWWLSWVRAILEAGADGVEIRRVGHASSFTYGEFGFEQPVRDEFLKRTGVDIWKTDDFDRALWRRVRGEGYTQFCRDAREITRRAGKTIGLHVDSGMNMEPEEGACMEIHWDWRTWIKEGLADYILLKHEPVGTCFAQEVLSLAREKGIDAVISIFLFSRQWKQPGCENALEREIRAVRDAGFDGFQYYGTAALVQGLPERQRVVFKNPAQRKVLAENFKSPSRE